MGTIATDSAGSEGARITDPPGSEPAPALGPGGTDDPSPGGAGVAAEEGGPGWPELQGSDAEMAARMRLAILRLSRRLRQQVAGGVTSSQVSALATVERLGTPTLGELASSERVQPPSMTKIVVALEAAGLVSRQEDDSDRRIARVKLTAEGRRTLQRSRSLRNAYLVRRLRRLPPEERAALGAAVLLLEHLVEQP
ncbi:MAG TPA: MarR family transcriptional regulator [Acidimicrobiales bacterium]|nr:MarR family transcriptional regulator [Acidimicrobiales bacterium]